MTHYWSYDSFLADRELLAGMGRVAAIPGVLIHGRHDISGPLETAWELHRAWPGSRLVVLDAGHGGRCFADALRALGQLHQTPSPQEGPPAVTSVPVTDDQSVAKLVCPCGTLIRSSGAIPNPQEWHLVKDLDLEQVSSVARLSNDADIATFAQLSRLAYRCENCGRLPIYWDMEQTWPPTIHVPEEARE